MILAKLEYDKVIEIITDQIEIPTIGAPYQYITEKHGSLSCAKSPES